MKEMYVFMHTTGKTIEENLPFSTTHKNFVKTGTQKK